MIRREDILSMEYLKKTDYTGSHEGMRYRMENIKEEDRNLLRVYIWPEPFNFAVTPKEQKQQMDFTFDEDGILDAVAWMNDRLFADKEKWENSGRNWDTYQSLK